MQENKYYVYLHRRLDNGVIFYVGKGTKNRASEISRSKNWKSVVQDAGGFTIDIYKDNLSNAEALKLEEELLVNPLPGWQLINQHVFRSIDYNRRDWNELFEYDETSKSCLRWKKSRYPKRIGKEVGSYHQCGSTGYWNVNVDGRMHKIHRIIWVMFNGHLEDDMLINHINNDCKDNRLVNLEKCTPLENGNRSKIQNIDLMHEDSYLRERVFHHEINGQVFEYPNVNVSIRRNGETIRKNFAYAKYGGKEIAWQLARLFRDAALRSFEEARNLDFSEYLQDSMLGISKGKATTSIGRVIHHYIVQTNTHSKQFSFNKLGGEANALAAAKKYRNETLFKGK
jgi:hypothetical protein